MACLFTQPHQNYNESINHQNNHHSEPSEIDLNWRLTTMEFKKPHSLRLVGGAKTWNRLVSHPRVVDKNLGGISWEWGVPATEQAPSPGFQGQEGKSSQLLAAKTNGECVGGRNCLSPKPVLLKNPHIDSPTQTHSLWALELGWQLEGHQWHTGRGWSVWHWGEQRPLSLFWALLPYSRGAGKLVPCLRLQQPG